MRKRTFPYFLFAGLALVLTLPACAGQAASTDEAAVDEPASDAPEESDTGVTADYSVELGPADFVEGIDNPFLPFIPGTEYVYEATLEDGGREEIIVEVLPETREVMGVTATVVRDRVFVDGELVEDTHDWYGQDTDGNVWYLGEDVDNYEDGVLVDHEGAWEWGVDGALSGIIMWADPAAHVGEAYYQEYYVGEAEDMGEVLSVGESVSVPYGSFDNALQTYDFSSLDPEIMSHKFYVEGIGVVKEVELNVEEEVVLIEYTTPAAGPYSNK